MRAVKATTQIAVWSRHYETALRSHLGQNRKSSLEPAAKLGRRAVTLGLDTLAVARVHAQVLKRRMSPAGKALSGMRAIAAASDFFAETVVPIEKTHRAARNAGVRVAQLEHALQERTAEVTASTRRLQRSIIRRQGAETALKESGSHRARLLREALRLQAHLQQATRAMLRAREHARQKMSRKLYDEIAQRLLGIHVRLLALEEAMKSGAEGVRKGIGSTQRLVKESARKVDRFAHEYGIENEA